MYKIIIVAIILVFIKNGLSLAIPNTKPIVIIGGGPTGLASALTFVKLGYKDITVIEKRKKNKSFDVGKAYLYLIDGRGQTMTNELGLTPKIAEKAVSSSKFQNLTEILPDSTVNIKQLPILSKEGVEKYWIPRDQLIDVFENAIKEAPVRVIYDSQFKSLKQQEDGRLMVEIESTTTTDSTDSSSSTRVLPANLLVGCDGMNSAVRTRLAQDENKFNIRKLPSDASKLQYKILTIKSSFPLPDGSGTSNPETAYAIRSIGKKTKTTGLSLGLLPVKKGATRTANLICLPEHELWSFDIDGSNNGCNVDSFKDYLKMNFPQIPLNEFVDEEEIQRFVQADKGYFPSPQYCKGLSSSKKPVCLAGDAAHAFPPDLGQGVNSGLADIYSLYDALKETNNDIDKGLKLYEDRRAPEIAALTKMMVFGYPYQYNHMPFKNKLFLLNFAARLVLSKAIPWLIAPPAFLQLQTHTNTYTSIMAKVRRTTMLLTAVVTTLTSTVMKRFFPKSSPILVYVMAGTVFLRELWLISM